MNIAMEKSKTSHPLGRLLTIYFAVFSKPYQEKKDLALP